MKLPQIGFGTYKHTGEAGQKAIAEALRAGYRLLDTAAFYGNEKEVAAATEASDVPREEIIIATKVWKDSLGYDAVRRAIDTSLKKLRTPHLDLCLIHWPAPPHMENRARLNAETWRALENAREEGQIREIGLSNFLVSHLSDLFLTAHHKPFCNEIEFHPGYTQQPTVQFCQAHGIQVLGWSPLARGKIFELPAIRTLAEKYGKTPGQICLRYAIQQGTIPLPKATTPSRMQENLAIFDFSLTEEEIMAIDALPETGFSGYHPDLH